MKFSHIFLGACMFVCGCAQSPKLDISLPFFKQEVFLILINGEKSVLYCSHEDANYHFLLFDGLGIPLANKTLEKGKFKPTKPLRSHSLHDKIFTEVLQMLQKHEKEREMRIRFTQISIIKL